MGKRFAIASLFALAGCGESPLMPSGPDASATVDAATAPDLASPDLAAPDLACWIPHICSDPMCCDPQCVGAVDYGCPNDPCATPSYECRYFEYRCTCGDDHKWQYVSTMMPPDFSLPVDLAAVD